MPTAPRTPAHRKTPIAAHKGAQPPRMRPALRLAVEEIVWKGVTQREAAHRAGMNETALGRALARPAIAAWLEYLKAQAALDADKLKAHARAIAIREGTRLITEAQSEQVRARMVEFFAGEAKPGSQVNVQVNVDRGGYEFVRPGARMVEIEPAPDSASGAEEAQEPDN